MAKEYSHRNMVRLSIVEEEPHISNPVIFCDWLNDKPLDWQPVKSKPVYLENWLEW